MTSSPRLDRKPSLRTIRPVLIASRLCLALVVGSASVDGQQFGTHINVTAIEVSASVHDANGKVPRDLTPADFVLIEDGKPQPIIGVADSRARPGAESPANANSIETKQEPERPAQIVIYLQQSLSTTEGLRLAIKSLEPQAGRFVALGAVEVVTDDPTHTLFGPTRDAIALRSFLDRLGNDAEGQEELIRVRRAFTTGDQNTTGPDRLTRRSLARTAARQEQTVLRARQDAMLFWLSRYPHDATGHSMRLLVFITAGFDLAPAAYYRVDANDLRADLRDDLRLMNASAHQDEIAHTLAAEGWTILSLVTGPLVSHVTQFDAATHHPLEIGEFENVLHSSHQTLISKAPLDPLKRLADATGGSVLTDLSLIDSRLDDLDQRVVITYQVARPSDDKLRRVEIRAVRAGLTINSQKWVGGVSTEAMADATAAVLATAMASGSGGESGRLPVTCSIQLGSSAKGVRTSEIEVRIDTAPIGNDIASADAGTLRFTLAVVNPNEPPFTSTNRLEHLDFSSRQGWSTSIRVQHRDGATMAVIAEESSTGAWGSCVVAPEIR